MNKLVSFIILCCKKLQVLVLGLIEFKNSSIHVLLYYLNNYFLKLFQDYKDVYSLYFVRHSVYLYQRYYFIANLPSFYKLLSKCSFLSVQYFLQHILLLQLQHQSYFYFFKLFFYYACAAQEACITRLKVLLELSLITICIQDLSSFSALLLV